MSGILNEAVFEKFPKLSSARLIFRDFKERDLPMFFKLRTDPMVLKYMDALPLKKIEDAAEMIEHNRESFKEKKGIIWALEEKASDYFIGYFLLFNINHPHARAEIGYALNPEYWGKGFMKEAINTVLQFAFKSMNIHRIEANINPENLRSEELLKQNGFIKEAHFKEHYRFNGKFVDSVIYSKLDDGTVV